MLITRSQEQKSILIGNIFRNLINKHLNDSKVRIGKYNSCMNKKLKIILDSNIENQPKDGDFSYNKNVLVRNYGNQSSIELCRKKNQQNQIILNSNVNCLTEGSQSALKHISIPLNIIKKVSKLNFSFDNKEKKDNNIINK